MSRKDSQSISSLASKKAQIFTSAEAVTGIPLSESALTMRSPAPELARTSTVISP